MSSDQIIHELFQNLEKTIHERLQVIEEVIRSKGINGRSASNVLDNLSYRVGMLEAERSGVNPAVHVHRENSTTNVVEPSVPSTLFINAMKDLAITFKDAPEMVVSEDEAEEEIEEEVEVEEEEAEEEGVEVEEWTFKGRKYYKDTENKVYANVNGEVGDLLGTYDPVKNIVKK
jgi:hypothetical protein